MKIINNKKDAIQELERISRRTNSENNCEINKIVEEILNQVKNIKRIIIPDIGTLSGFKTIDLKSLSPRPKTKNTIVTAIIKKRPFLVQSWSIFNFLLIL